MLEPRYLVIDTSRWTANEREVVAAALLNYRSTLRSRKARTPSPIVQSDCQWRLVVISQSLDAIEER
jgi:hypothetical protein